MKEVCKITETSDGGRVARVAPAGRPRPRRMSAGFSGFFTLAALLLVLIVLATALTEARQASTEVRLAARSQDSTNALFLAEAGVDDCFDNVRSNGSYTGTGATPTAIYTNPPTNTIAYGSYTTVFDATNNKITATGTTANGVTKQVIAIISIPGFALGDGAMRAQSYINISGTPSIATNPVGSHVANVYSNSNITMSGSGNVDGRLAASGTVSGSGTASSYGTPVSGAPLQQFPSAATTTVWAAAWKLQALNGTGATTINGTFSGGTNATLTSPTWINGSMNLSGQSNVRINSNGTGVVYVEGDVTLSGQSTLTNSGLLIVMGSFNQSGGSTYSVRSNLISGYTPTVVVYNKSGTGGGISLSGGSLSNQEGVMYSVNGPISLSGNATFNGALVAGGSNGYINASGTFNQNFPTGMISPVTFPGKPVVTSVYEP